MTYVVFSVTSFHCSIKPLRKVIRIQAITRSMPAQHPLLFLPWTIYYFSLQMSSFLLEKPMIFSASSAALFRLVRYNADNVRISIVAKEDLTIWLVASNGKQVEVMLERDRCLALLIYLAVNEKGMGVLQSVLLEKIYLTDKDNMTEKNAQRLFNVDIYRMRLAFKQAAEKANWPYVDPLTNFKKSGRSVWCFSNACDVYVHSTLKKWDQKIKGFEKDPQKQGEIDREKLKAACAQIQTDYGEGFGAKYHGLEGFDGWLDLSAQEFRDMYMHILQFAAKIEIQYANDAKKEALARTAYWQAAVYLELYAREASVMVADKLNRRGEPFLRRSIEMYKLAHDGQSADIAFHTYKRRMLNWDEKWKPEPSTIEAWQKAIDSE